MYLNQASLVTFPISSTTISYLPAQKANKTQKTQQRPKLKPAILMIVITLSSMPEDCMYIPGSSSSNSGLPALAESRSPAHTFPQLENLNTHAVMNQTRGAIQLPAHIKPCYTFSREGQRSLFRAQVNRVTHCRMKAHSKRVSHLCVTLVAVSDPIGRHTLPLGSTKQLTIGSAESGLFQQQMPQRTAKPAGMRR